MSQRLKTTLGSRNTQKLVKKARRRGKKAVVIPDSVTSIGVNAFDT